MNYLRLYLGEMTSLALVITMLFLAGAVASRYWAGYKTIRTLRNAGIALALLVYLLSLVPSMAVNHIARGRIDRSGADQDQRTFASRHSGQGK